MSFGGNFAGIFLRNRWKESLEKNSKMAKKMLVFFRDVLIIRTFRFKPEIYVGIGSSF